MVIYVRDESGVLQTLRIPAYKGERGEAGVTPNIQIGDVITLESGQQATVVRRGDDENPIFDFAIPKGEDGKDGIFVGSVDDAPDYAQIVINDDPSPYDLFYENANVSYMGDTYTSLKEKADADIEYLLRKFGTQHYEGTDITATDTYMKRVSSAILKGQTLVNIFNKTDYSTGNRPYLTLNGDFINVAPSGIYTIKFFNAPKGKVQQFRVVERHKSFVDTIYASSNDTFKFTTTKDFTNFEKLIIQVVETSSGIITDEELANIKVILIKGDYTNQDIPYFEGMASVKAPTVKTIGTNLFDINVIPTTVNAYKRTPVITPTQREEISINPILKLTPNTTYTFSINSNGYNIPRHVIFGFSSKSDILFTINWASNAIDSTFEFTTDKTGEVYLHGYQTLLVDSNLPNLINTLKQCKIQLELGETKTAYEPYSSSSLTLPEEVILRSLPNGVCDTFNTRTGDYVQRIGEKTLEELSRIVSFSSIAWSNLSSHGAYQLVNIVNHINVNCNAHGQNMWSDNYAWAASYHGGSYDNPNDNLPNVFLAFSNDGHLRLMVRKTLIKPDSPQEVTSNDIMNWGRQSAILSTRIQYQLKTPIITTIDLKNQKIYSYDGTTYYTTASAQGHPAPILSIDVPTNTTKMIARQREEIEQQEQQLLEQEEVQNVLIESQLALYEQSLSTLDFPNEEPIPLHIQKLYELSRKYKMEGE